jgi:hypothetical protein
VTGDYSKSDAYPIAQELVRAPLVYIVFNSDLVLVAVNDVAVAEGLKVGNGLTSYFSDTGMAIIQEQLNLADGKAFECALESQKTVELILAPLSDRNFTGLWLRDTSELKIVQRQVQNLKKPQRKYLHQLGNLISTTLGYSELVGLMLDEDSMITDERLNALKRYQKEMNAGLQQAEALLQREQHGPVAVKGVGMSNRHILVVQEKAARTELFVELLRSQHFKVTSFLDAEAAIEFVNMNGEMVDLAIVSRIDALTHLLLESNSTVEIIVCASETLAFDETRMHALPDNPLDINELLTTVLDLFEANQ